MAIKLDCRACDSTLTMKPTKVPRFNFVLRLIGYIIVIPSLLGVVGALGTCFITTGAASEVMATAKPGAEAAGAALGASIGYGMAFFIGAGSLVGGTLGYLLLLSRKVFRCTRCSYILERA